MDKWLNYHHLLYFRTIALEGSISKASEKLKVGQPALSSQLKIFEEYLGIKLFDRVNKRLELTEMGKMTLEYANQINELGQTLLRTIESKEVQKTLHLTIGALDSIPKRLILDILTIAEKQHNCHYTIIEGSIEELMEQLARHEVDLIISDHAISSNNTSKIFCKKFLSHVIRAYAIPKFQELAENFPESLNGQKLIVPTDHSKLRADIDQFILQNSLDVEIVAQTQDTAVQKLLCLRGKGITFLPPFAARDFIKEKSMIELGELPDITTDYYLISSERDIKNPTLKTILDQNFDEIY